jgi:ectonucleotide pyrophosphatase/phosphodiesterase family protein 1/3
VWNTAGRQGLKSGTFFWPGSDAPIGGMYPNYYETYDSSVSFEERVLKILEWLDYPSTLRPQFLTMYLNEPDHAGHEGGPDSVQVDAALGRVDEVIEDLIVELKMRGIYDCINIIVVSDHGGCIFLLVRQFLFCILLYNDFNLTLMSKYCTTVCIE